MSGHYFPSSPNINYLLSCPPPHGSDILPKAEAVHASAEHSSHEMEDYRGLGTEGCQEWQYQEHHSGRNLKRLDTEVFHSLDDSPCNGNGGTKPCGRDSYSSDPSRGQRNGGQPFYDPHAALHDDWILPGKCQEDDHEERQCSLGVASGSAKKRKVREEQECCKRTKKGKHCKNCPSLASATQESGNFAKEPSISQYAIGANAVPQSIRRNTPIASTSADNDVIVLDSFVKDEALQSSSNAQMNSVNATSSTESASTINGCEIEFLLDTAEIDGLAKALSCAKTDVGHINNGQSSFIAAAESCGTNDAQNKKNVETPKAINGKNIRICSQCQLTKGQHSFGCINSKKFRTVRHQPEGMKVQFYVDLAYKFKMKQLRSQFMSEIRKTTGNGSLPTNREYSFDSIKKMPREELEQIVIGHFYSCERTIQDGARELSCARRRVSDLQIQINLMQVMQKRKNRKKTNQIRKKSLVLGQQPKSVSMINTTAMNYGVPCQQHIPFIVRPPVPDHVKVENAGAKTTAPSAMESSAANEERSVFHGSSPTISKVDVVQLPCHLTVSSNDKINADVKIEKEGANAAFFESHPHSVYNISAPSAPSAGHPMKQPLAQTGPDNCPIDNFQPSKARPSNSMKSSQAGPSISSGSSAQKRPQPSAPPNPCEQPYVRDYGNLQKRRQVQEVNFDCRLKKSKTIKVEASARLSQKIKAELLGSCELPIQIE